MGPMFVVSGINKLLPGDVELCTQEDLCPCLLSDSRFLVVCSCAQTDYRGNNILFSVSHNQL